MAEMRITKVETIVVNMPMVIEGAVLPQAGRARHAPAWIRCSCASTPTGASPAGARASGTAFSRRPRQRSIP